MEDNKLAEGFVLQYDPISESYVVMKKEDAKALANTQPYERKNQSEIKGQSSNCNHNNKGIFSMFSRSFFRKREVNNTFDVSNCDLASENSEFGVSQGISHLESESDLNETKKENSMNIENSFKDKSSDTTCNYKSHLSNYDETQPVAECDIVVAESKEEKFEKKLNSTNNQDSSVNNGRNNEWLRENYDIQEESGGFYPQKKDDLKVKGDKNAQEQMYVAEEVSDKQNERRLPEMPARQTADIQNVSSNGDLPSSSPLPNNDIDSGAPVPSIPVQPSEQIGNPTANEPQSPSLQPLPSEQPSRPPLGAPRQPQLPTQPSRPEPPKTPQPAPSPQGPRPPRPPQQPYPPRPPFPPNGADAIRLSRELYNRSRILNLMYQQLANIHPQERQTFQNLISQNLIAQITLLNIYFELSGSRTPPYQNLSMPRLGNTYCEGLLVTSNYLQDMIEINVRLQRAISVPSIDRQLVITNANFSAQKGRIDTLLQSCK